ncbi:aldo/keto reductase [Clostridia bacterium]|nr:aldo/keto reductase [Clostridia bacterium]
MNYRKFGKTGYDVSALGLGCMRLPRVFDAKTNDFGTEVDLEKAFEIIRYAADHGITYFDTAFGYHGQKSEGILGEALEENGRRKKVKIATKQPINVMTDRAAIRRNLEDTLKKLRTDYIDVYLMHNIQGGTWEKFQQVGAIEEFEKAKSEGLIKTIGFSFHGGYADFEKIINGYDGWEMAQVQHNLLDLTREATISGVELAGKKGVALAIMEPLRGGGLASAPKAVRELYDSYEEKRTPAEWAFKYLLDRPEVSVILSGMSTLEQLKENIALFGKADSVENSLSDKERNIIAEAKKRYESIITIPCTKCYYCMPCPKGVSIPEIFGKYNDAKMFESYDNPRRTYMFDTRFGHDASNCVECGACEKKCPQKIEIIKNLKVAHEALKGWVE